MDTSKSLGRPTWAEINLDALAHNLHVVRGRAGAQVRVMAAVKANAYGHGAVECARRLESEGVDWFGVALPEEGIELRRAGLARPILCLGGFWKGQEAACLEQRLTPVVYRLDLAQSPGSPLSFRLLAALPGPVARGLLGLRRLVGGGKSS